MANHLSKTYFYVLTADGHLLYTQRLSHAQVFSLARKEFQCRQNREAYFFRSEIAAKDAFETICHFSKQRDFITVEETVLDAWMEYIAHAEQYGQLNEYRHIEGVHIVLVGWRAVDGACQLRLEIALNETELNPTQLQAVVYCALENAAVVNARQMPHGYISMNDIIKK
jgi:hypothetical protein